MELEGDLQSVTDTTTPQYILSVHSEAAVYANAIDLTGRNAAALSKFRYRVETTSPISIMKPMDMDKHSPGCILGFALFAITALAAVFGVTYVCCLGVAWITGWATFHSFVAVLGCAAFALGSWLLVSILRSVEGLGEELEDLGIHISAIDEMLHEHLEAGKAEEGDDGDDNDSGGKPLKVVR